MKLYGIALGLLFSTTLTLTGCFSPERPGSLNCSSEGECPSGMSCGSDNVCLSDSAMDANTDGLQDDASVLPDSRQMAVDAGIPNDAALVGCSNNVDCETPPDLCRLPGTCNLDTGTCSFPDVECEQSTTCLNKLCNPETGQCESLNVNEGNICIAESCDGFGLCGDFDSGNVCDEIGTQSQECMESICTSGSCIAGSRTDVISCNVSTTGMECLGGTTCDAYGACGGFDSNNSCDEGGTRSRECTDRTCASGNCAGTPRSEMENCSRVTDGDECSVGGSMGTTCGEFGACSYSNECDESGTRERTCTDRTCANGGCSETIRPEIEVCARSKDGDTCGAVTTCGAFGPCLGFMGQCDTSGTQSQTCTDYTCSNDLCLGDVRTETMSCSRPSREGLTCDFSTTCQSGQSGFQEICCNANESCTAFCGPCEQ